MLLLAVTNNKEELAPSLHSYALLTPWPIQKEIKYLSMELGKDYVGGYVVKYKDELEDLFDKFDFKYEYRDYFRQICSVQNVDPILAISLARIESHAGNYPTYNNMTEDRMYYTNGVKTWDLGIFQMSSYYEDYWRECFFNPSLIHSLGYMRESFNIKDDIISIQTGVAYLGFLIKYYHGDTEKAIFTYNTGYKRVKEGTVLEITKQYSYAIHNQWMFRDREV
jgi:hypothetical protein